MRLGIVVPCYNEREALPATHRSLLSILRALVESGQIAEESRIYYIDDGSSDGTWELIESLGQHCRWVAGIKLSRNCGHQDALLAGLYTASGDAIVSVDADLQDDVAVIPTMVAEYGRGIDIVYGVRKSRLTDHFLKRCSSEAFYRLMRILGVDLVFNHADCRLMSRRAVEALKQFREVNLFLRGIVPLIGLPSSVVHYQRAPRVAGLSKYSFHRMLALALEGITSFSIAPLRLITWLGLVVFFCTLAMSAYALWIKLFSGRAVPGWASTVLPLYLLGGLQILCLGVIGEYLGKMYKETKARPRYLIEQSFNL